jgi:hypothetical protein
VNGIDYVAARKNANAPDDVFELGVIAAGSDAIVTAPPVATVPVAEPET